MLNSKLRWSWTIVAGLMASGSIDRAVAEPIRTGAGMVEGTIEPGTRVRTFKGIPFAAPPVGDLRWRAPRPVEPWQGVRPATTFGARCMQGPIFADMIFRDEPSEDCLYLNVWTPAASPGGPLPVMVWIYGGAFQAGSSSEPRQEGAHLAAKGVVIVSFNYRLGVFGFLSHPALTKESGHGASGNYGLMDMIAALRWVQTNIRAFGGDPGNVTIFGESAGSFSVSALVASPLARGLFQKAIGESGAFFTVGDQTLALHSLAAGEQAGSHFAASLEADSISALRARPAGEILAAALGAPMVRFRPNVDGYVLPQDVYAIYAAGRQHPVPLLAGWNADEARAGAVLGPNRPDARSFAERLRKEFGDESGTALRLYPAGSDAEAMESAASLATDLFTGYSTWKWIEMHASASRVPVYRYSFDRKIPVAPGTKINGVEATARDVGARHAGEIEYVFGTLDSVPNVSWPAPDRTLSDRMMTYWTNFARSGDPNGSALPRWPRYTPASGRQVLRLDEVIRSGADPRQARYEFLDAHTGRLRAGSDRRLRDRAIGSLRGNSLGNRAPTHFFHP